MLERWCEKLVQLGKTNPRLRWPLVALLALLYGGLALWVGAKALGASLFAVGREAAEHLRETGGEIAGGLKWLQRWCKDHLPLAMARGREASHASRQWSLNRFSTAQADLRALLARGKELGGALTRRTACGAARAAETVRADLPALRRHAPRRAMAMALTLCMALSLLPAEAVAAEASTNVDTSACTHVHGEACYARTLICGMEEAEGHVHGDECYTAAPVCGQEERAGHVHTDACYEDALDCQLPEHTHTDSCYTDGTPTCGLEEHVHGETCYARTLICGMEEAEGHAHGDECYTAAPVCGQEERQGHVHTDACYEDALDCRHVHDETCGGLTPPEPEEPGCTCGAQPEGDAAAHAPDCPLYVPPADSVCAFCGEEGHTSENCPYEAHTCRLCGGDHPTYECARFDSTQRQPFQEVPEEDGEGSYEDVAALVSALPSLEDVLALDPQDADGMEALGDCYAAVRAVWDAMFLLPPAEYRRAEDKFALTLGALEDAALAAFDSTGVNLMAVDDPDSYDYEGNGTATSPYLISSKEQLYDLAHAVNSHNPKNDSLAECQQMQGVYFKLTADIDVGDGSQDNRYSTWLPIGFNEKGSAYVWPVFAGTFDGDGYRVSGIRRYIGDMRDDQVLKDYGGLMGLFGKVSGVVKNVIIDDSVIGSNTDDFLDMVIGGDPKDPDKLALSATYTAAVAVSVVSSAGRIENCSTTENVTVRAFSYAAGIVVSSAGSVVFCENNAKIESPSSAAGIVSTAGSRSRTEYCVNRGLIYSLGQASGEVAGVVGTSAGDVIACRNEGRVTTEGYSSVLGGVAGDAFGGTVSSCCNLGAVEGDGAAVGGIVGRVVEKTVVRNSYNAGTVTGGEDTHRTVSHRNMCVSLYKWYPSTLGQIVGEDTSAPFTQQGNDFGAIATSGDFVCDNGIYPASDPPYVGSSGVYENVHYDTASATQPMGWDRQGLTCDHVLFGRNLKKKYQGYPKPEDVDATKTSGSFFGTLEKSVLEGPSYAAMEALWKDQNGLPVQERSYLVQLRGNGGKVEGETLLGGGRVPEGTLVSLEGCTATYDDHTFQGWSLVPDGAAVTGSYTVDPKDATGGYITLYAKWTSTRSDHLTLVDLTRRYDPETNPVAVTSAMDLNYIAYQRKCGGALAVYGAGGVLYDDLDATEWSYRVTADLDFADIPYSSMTSIGADQRFDGGGHTVKHLTVPLFAWAQGTIRDLIFEDCAIAGAGALAERGEGATVSGCTVADSVSVTYSGGGIYSDTPVGGLIGDLRSGTVYDCASAATVVSGGYGPTGGLVGDCSGGVYNSYSGAAPAGNGGGPVGGLAGSVNAGGLVENCYFYRYEAGGTANFPDRAGLIAGALSGRLRSCFAVGSTEALFAAKSSSATLYNCASSLTDRFNAQLAGAGARDEYPLADLLNSYVFADKTGRPYSGWAVFPRVNRGYPVHAAGSLNPLFSTDSGWSVTEGGIISGTVPTDPWTGHTEEPGTGASGVYEIGTPGQLAHVAANPGTYAAATLILTADLDLSQYVWTPITGFGGTFDGQGHTISGLYTVTGDQGGLFAAVTATGTVKNLGVDQSYLLAAAAAGAIAAENAGTIRNCWSLAYVNAATAGGIAGTNRGTVSHVSAAGSVSGETAGAVTGTGSAPDHAWFRADRAHQADATGYAAREAAATAAALTVEDWQTAGFNSWRADEVRGFPVFAFRGALTPMTIHFDANGGVLGGTYPDLTGQRPGSVLDLSGYTATQTDRLFLGWAPKADAAAGVKQYTVRAEDGADGVVTLYAVLRDASDNLWPLDRDAAYSANNPLVISSVKDWGLFRAALAVGGDITYFRNNDYGTTITATTDARTANYKLTADLDFGGETWTAVTQYGGDTAASPGPVFDGGGHTLRGVHSEKESVFALVKNATVQNLSIADSAVAGGGLVDVLEDGAVQNCHARSDVSVTTVVQDGVETTVNSSGKVAYLRAHAGGIVGMATGAAACTIRSCTSAASVAIRVDEAKITLPSGTTDYYSYLYAGGIVGRIVGRTEEENQPALNVAISDCTNLGAVTSSGTEAKKASAIYHYDGGIVGMASSAVTLTRCANRGAVEAETTWNLATDLTMDHYVGGLAGQLSSGALSGCGNRGAVTVTVKGEEAYVENSWVDYAIHTGGLVGRADAVSISKCFNTGDVRIDSKYVGKNHADDLRTLYVEIREQHAGGLVGDYSSLSAATTMSNCFNWGDVSSDAPRRLSDQYNTVYLGGAIGHTRAAATAVPISRVYSIGDVTYRYDIANPTPEEDAVFVSGFLANDNCYSSQSTASKSIALSNCHVLERTGKGTHWYGYYADAGYSSSSSWKDTGISPQTYEDATGTLMLRMLNNSLTEAVWAPYDGDDAYPVFASTDDNVWSQEAVAPPESTDGTPAITYVLNGGVNRAGNLDSVGKMAGRALQDPTRAGCLFQGWYREDGTPFTGPFTGKETGAMTLTAKWKYKTPVPPQDWEVTAAARTLTVSGVSGQEYYCCPASETPDFSTATWTPCADVSAVVFSSLTANTAYHLYTRVPEDRTTVASDPSAALEAATLAANPTYIKPTALMAEATDTTITVTSVTPADQTYEYAVYDSAYQPHDLETLDWQMGRTFTGLNPDKYPSGYNYWVYVRVAGTTGNTYLYVTPNAVVTAPLTPAAPALAFEAVGMDSVTIQAVAGAEYRLGDGDWQDGNTFSGLTPATAYSFAIRVKAADTTAASPETRRTVYTQAPAGTGYTVDYVGELFFVEEGYTLKSGDTVLPSGSAAVPGGSYTIRCDRTPGLSTAFTLPERPEAPTDLFPRSASTQFSADGAIAGAAAGMEYGKAGDAPVYTAVTPTVRDGEAVQAGLLPGRYVVRCAATDHSFHGLDASVEVKVKASTTTYTVIFQNGGEELSRLTRLAYGAEVSAPAVTLTPPEAGMLFTGWYSTETGLDESGQETTAQLRWETPFRLTPRTGATLTLNAGWASYADLFASADLSGWRNAPFALLGKDPYATVDPAAEEPGNGVLLNVESETAAGSTQTVYVSGGGSLFPVEVAYYLDTKVPAAPAVAATVDGAAYDGNFVAKDVVLTPAGTATVSGHAKDQYTTDGGATWHDVAGGSVTHSAGTPAEGVRYQFRSVNNAGTAGAASEPVTVKINRLSEDELAASQYGPDDINIAPESSGGWYNQKPTVTVTKKDKVGTGDDALAATTYYELYKQPAESGTRTELTGATISPADDGRWTLKIWTEDAAGNRTAPYVIPLNVDTAAPTVTVEGMGDDGVNKIWADEKTLTIRITDGLSGVRYVQLMGQVAADTTVEYGPDADFGQKPIPENGVYTYTVRANDVYTITAYDNADNQPLWSGELPTFVVEKIDREKPVASFGAITGTRGADGWFTGTVTVNVAVVDPETIPDDEYTIAINESNKSGVKSWEYSLDGGTTWSTGGGSSFTIDAGGDYTGKLKLRATDNAGNASETATGSVKLDKTAPVVSLAATAGGAPYDGSAFTAHDVVITPGNTAENVSGVTYFYQKTGDADWTELTGGALTVDFNCDATFTFKAVSGAGVESSNRPTVPVKRSAMSDEELAETEYGENDFAIDPSSNEDGWHNETPTVTVTPKATVGEGGLEAATCYELFKAPAAGGNKTELTAPWTIQPDSDGVWTLNIWTEDAAGNKTKTYTLTLMIDTTAPTITGITGNPATWQREDADITFTAGDATSGVKTVAVKRDDTAGYAVTNNGGFTADGNGSYVITVTDQAGNSAAETVEVTKIDKAAPVVTWSETTAKLSPDKWYGKTALAAEATDDSGETSAITLTASGKTYANSATIAVTGSYTFYATAKDGAGNVGRSTALTVRIETAIDDFVAMVNGLSSGSGYQDILDAVTWYESQSQTVKDRFSKSDAATEAYETLMGLLRDKAQEAANGVAEEIRNADTIDEIEQAAKDYNALPDDAKDKIPSDVKDELEKKKADADAAQKVIEQLENADRPKDGKDPGGSYEEKGAALDAYDALTDDQKALVDQNTAATEDKGHIDADLSAIDHVLDLLKDIKKPYTPATKDQIKAAGDAYNHLSDKQKDAFPKDEKARLDELEEMRQHAQAAEDRIKALGDPPTQDALNTAKGAYDSLTADEKAMVDGALKDALNQKYQDMLDGLDADQKAAAEFATKVEEVKNHPTVDKIEQLIKDHDALTPGAAGHLSNQTKQDYQNLVDDLNKAKDVISKLDGIDPKDLTPDDMDNVKDALDGYGKLDDDQKTLVDDATNGKPGILDEAVKGADDATEKIKDIPSHGDGSDIGPGCPGYDGHGAPTGENHDYDQHRKSIEEAKIAYERLTDAGRRLVSDTAKEKLNHEYAALISYLEYVNTARTANTSVEVAGLAEKVELPAESASAPKTVLSVVMTDSKPAAMPPVPAGKTEALSVDVKLVASIYDSAEADAPVVATEQVQPKAGQQVLVKLMVPSGYQNDTLELWHVKDNGSRSRIEDFWLVTESDGTYAVFEVSSFSHFVFYAEKTQTGGSGGNWTPPAPKPDIPDTDHGSTTVNPQRPKPGDTVTITPRPDEGYVVDKVIVTDQNGKNIFVKDNGDGSCSYTQPNGKVTVTVTFKPEETRLPWNPFTDVKDGDWFYESVKYVYENGLMLGTASDKFSPYLDTSRGMIVTILWRLEGGPEATAASSFSDVAADTYYAKAVAWGAENSIVKGYGNGNFGPNDPITREQLAAILYRYAQFKGMETPTEGMAIGNFSDGGEVSGWARDAMRWCLGQGIISGKGGGILDPTGRASRVETAVMLQRFLSLQ